MPCNSMFFTPLLRHNYIQSAYLKVYDPIVFSMFTVLCNHNWFQNLFITPKRNSVPIISHFPSPVNPLPFTNPRQPLIYFLSLWICVIWTFHINGIMQYVMFCEWFLSTSIMFTKFVHVITCISTLFLFIDTVFHYVDILYFI